MDKDTLLEFIEITAILIELVGVLILILGTIIALIHHISKIEISSLTYKLLRQQLRKNILVGLDFLVVGSLIKKGNAGQFFSAGLNSFPYYNNQIIFKLFLTGRNGRKISMAKRK